MVFLVFNRTAPPFAAGYYESLFATIDMKVNIMPGSSPSLYNIRFDFRGTLTYFLDFQINMLQLFGFYFTGDPTQNFCTLYCFIFDNTKSFDQMWTATTVNIAIGALQGGLPTVGLNSDTVNNVSTTTWPFQFYDIIFYRYPWFMLSLASRQVMVNAIRAKWQIN